MTDARERQGRLDRDHYDNEFVVTGPRERLEQAIANALNDGWQHEAGRLADKLLAAGVTLAPEPPAPRPVWPGTDAMREAHRLSSADRSVASWWALTPEDYSAIAAAGWRALVARLPHVEGVGMWNCVNVGGYRVPREHLAALADPYDGGGKGVGK